MKGFKRATIEAMDDGSFSVTVCLPEKKKESEDGEDSGKAVTMGYGDEKRMTAATLDEAIDKIMSASDSKEDEEDSGDKSKTRLDGLMRRLQTSLGGKLKEAAK